MLKTSENPPVLYPFDGTVAAIPGNWFVAHTKSRFEKALAWDLLHAEIPYFLPLVERHTFSGGRKRTVLSPLFPSYLFFSGDAQQRHTAIASHRICNVLPVTDRSRFVAELSAIEKALVSGSVLDVYSFAAVGQRCRVSRGPLMGVEGTVVRVNDHTKLVLHVSMLGQGASLEISPDLLEPV